MKIAQIASAFPEWCVNSYEIAEWVDADPDFIRDKIGIIERRFLRAQETATELAATACENLFAKTEVSRSDIDILILVTQNAEYKLPHGSALLQDILELPTSVAAFDLNLGCSGYVYGLTIAKGVMQATAARNALLVTCDPYSKIMQRHDKNTVSLFGDAASATLLSQEGELSIGNVDLGTDGSGAENLIVGHMGSEHGVGIHACDEAANTSDAYLSMNGRAIFNFMMDRVPESVTRCLDSNGLAKEEVDYFVFHQASRYLLESVASRMKLPLEKVPISISHCGNTVSSSIPIALEKLMQEHDVRNKNILLSGFGVGLSWGSILLQGEA